MSINDKLPTEADTDLGKALCGKLRELAALPPTVRSLVQLEHTARLAREILVSAIDPHALKGNRLQSMGMQYGGIAMNPNMAIGGYDGPLPGGALAPSSYSENFGAAVLRELGATKGETAETKVLDIVAAIAFCREKGGEDMHKLADELTHTLMKAVGERDQPEKSTPKVLETSASTENVEAAQ